MKTKLIWKGLALALTGFLVISCAKRQAGLQNTGAISPAAPSVQEEQPPAAEVTPDPWPKVIDLQGAKYTIYQPQLDKWDGFLIEAHAAVSVLPAEAKDPVFGAIEIAATTVVDRPSRVVTFYDITVTKATFPSSPDSAARYQVGFQSMLQGPSTMSLDRLEAMLSVEEAEKKGRGVLVKNEPPKFVFSQTPAVLISIDGEPIWRPVKGTSFERILNTSALVLRDSSGKIYLHLLDGFVEAQTLSGPWAVAKSVDPEADRIANELEKEKVVDLMMAEPDEKNPEKKLSLKNGVPKVIVAMAPTELLITQGAPDWMQIEGTTPFSWFRSFEFRSFEFVQDFGLRV
jgi:hypothetical protein